VLRQLHPDTGISARAMAIMDSCMKDIKARLLDQVLALCEKEQSKTINARDIQAPIPLSR
jgi:histone H2B